LKNKIIVRETDAMIDRRTSRLGVAAALTAGLPRIGFAAGDGLVDRAKAEGEVTFYTSADTLNAEAVAVAFKAKYGIKVKLFRAGGSQIAQKLTLELRARRLEADITELSDPTMLSILFRQGAVDPYESVNGAILPASFRHPKYAWYGTAFIFMHLIVNKDQVSPAEEPKSWSHIADPKWKGKLVWGSPNYGSSQYATVKGLLDLHGWDLIEKMKANETMVIQGWPEAENAVASGERLVGGDASGRSFRALAKGAPLRNVYPEEGSIVSLGAASIMKPAKHPNAARLLLEFILSIEGQSIYAENYVYSVRPDVPAQGNLVPLKDIKLHSIDYEQAVDQHDEIVRRWTQLMER
jgi:iron(III) transport system substrate-binding protein